MREFLEAGYLTPAVVAVTSVLAIAIGLRFHGMNARGLRKAALGMLQSLGFMGIFYVLNLAASFLLIEAARLLSGSFVSHYFAGNAFLIRLSLLQALVFRNWIAARPSTTDSAS